MASNQDKSKVHEMVQNSSVGMLIFPKDAAGCIQIDVPIFKEGLLLITSVDWWQIRAASVLIHQQLHKITPLAPRPWRRPLSGPWGSSTSSGWRPGHRIFSTFCASWRKEQRASLLGAIGRY